MYKILYKRSSAALVPVMPNMTLLAPTPGDRIICYREATRMLGMTSIQADII